jgi:hypothetical protein
VKKNLSPKEKKRQEALEAIFTLSNEFAAGKLTEEELERKYGELEARAQLTTREKIRAAQNLSAQAQSDLQPTPEPSQHRERGAIAGKEDFNSIQEEAEFILKRGIEAYLSLPGKSRFIKKYSEMPFRWEHTPGGFTLVWEELPQLPPPGSPRSVLSPEAARRSPLVALYQGYFQRAKKAALDGLKSHDLKPLGEALPTHGFLLLAEILAEDEALTELQRWWLAKEHDTPAEKNLRTVLYSLSP